MSAQAGMHFLDASAPAGLRIYAIGDIHGRLDLLEAMHDAIAHDCMADGVTRRAIVHLGDYVDRGADSRGVIERLISFSQADRDVHVLAGNHDIGFVDFLANPEGAGLFARFGGAETAASYGVNLDFKPGLLDAGWRELCSSVPTDHVDFIRGLPVSLVLGDFFFCHAGVAPGIPLDRQSAHDLMWIRDPFHKHPGLFEKVIVHGHTPVGEPEVLPNRVNVDTAAYRSGVLTALVIDATDKRFISVRLPRPEDR